MMVVRIEWIWIILIFDKQKLTHWDDIVTVFNELYKCWVYWYSRHHSYGVEPLEFPGDPNVLRIPGAWSCNSCLNKRGVSSLISRGKCYYRGVKQSLTLKLTLYVSRFDIQAQQTSLITAPNHIIVSQMILKRYCRSLLPPPLQVGTSQQLISGMPGDKCTRPHSVIIAFFDGSSHWC